MNGQGCGEGDRVEQEPGEAAQHQPGSDHQDEHQVCKALVGRTHNNQISYNLENMVTKLKTLVSSVQLGKT